MDHPENEKEANLFRVNLVASEKFYPTYIRKYAVNTDQPNNNNNTVNDTDDNDDKDTRTRYAVVDPREDAFPQGCRFSPDGLCVLTSQCHRLLLYNTPNEAFQTSSSATATVEGNDENGGENTMTTTTTTNAPNDSVVVDWKPELDIPAGEKVRSYEWYPHMDSSNPASCCFVATSR